MKHSRFDLAAGLVKQGARVRGFQQESREPDCSKLDHNWLPLWIVEKQESCEMGRVLHSKICAVSNEISGDANGRNPTCYWDSLHINPSISNFAFFEASESGYRRPHGDDQQSRFHEEGSPLDAQFAK